VPKVLEEWARAVRRLSELTRRREDLQRRHPEWHRLKVLAKARQEIDRARRRARQRRVAHDPRALEQHPRWAALAARSRRDIARNTDRLDRKPYSRGLQHPRYSAPDWVYGDDPAVYSAAHSGSQKPTV